MNLSLIINRIQNYAILMRLHRPIGIYLLLWPTLWAIWVAATGFPQILTVLVFIAGVVLMRSAGCVINDYADRKVDKHVQRTKQRPITTGQVSPKEALILFSILCLIAFALVLLLNTLTIILAFAGLFLAVIYPFMKRYTYFPQVFLGLAFGWAIPMAFAAELGYIPYIAWILFIINILWVIAYDTMYAMVDREDDLKIGVKSTAIFFGNADRIVIASLQVLVLILLLWVGLLLWLNWTYYLALAVAAGLASYQQWLIRQRQPELCLQAFLNNHWFGLVIFVGLAMSYYVP